MLETLLDCREKGLIRTLFQSETSRVRACMKIRSVLQEDVHDSAVSEILRQAKRIDVRSRETSEATQLLHDRLYRVYMEARVAEWDGFAHKAGDVLYELKRRRSAREDFVMKTHQDFLEYRLMTRLFVWGKD